ncbi:amidohydrolase family protein [Flavobacteriaceae bacterium TK19130]|nr:amidohydrolase family protein [Thermobacterium salinum]
MRYYIPILLFLIQTAAFGQITNSQDNLAYTGPIIDMHLHAFHADAIGPPPIPFCVPASTSIQHFDPRVDYMEVVVENSKNPSCNDLFWSPKTDEELIRQTINQLEKYNAIGVLSGEVELLSTWTKAAPDRFIPSLEFNLGTGEIPVDSLKTILRTQNIKVFGEIGNQYYGIAPNDPRMDKYWELAVELDIPVAIHLGSGPPGAPYMGTPNYRVKFSNPLQLEEVLVKYPKLRMSVMHYGEPFIDEMIAMMYTYPQLYIDLGGIMWTYPKAYFYEYHLKKLVAAGYSKRIMFGSDSMTWPGLIGMSIDIINEAPFLSLEEKEDIFYNNAARFLRFSEEQIAADHNRKQ